MDASLKPRARGSFRRRPILEKTGCFGKNCFPLRVLESARTGESVRLTSEPRSSAPGFDGEVRQLAATGSAFVGLPGFGSAFERLTSIEALTAAWNRVRAEDLLDQQLRRQAKEIAADLKVFLERLPPTSGPGCTSQARYIRSNAKGAVYSGDSCGYGPALMSAVRR